MWLGLIAAVWFGLCFGSFCSVLIYRLYSNTPGIVAGNSACPHCKHRLHWYNLVPLFSYIFQRGTCAYCPGKISIWYPLFELISAITFTIAYTVLGAEITAIPVYITIIFALVLGLYDGRYMLVDRRVSLPAIAWGLVYGLVFTSLGWQSVLIGGAIGYAFYALQYYGSGGRWVGKGDLELGLFMGFCLGWKYMLLALFLSYIIGTIACIPLLIFQKKTMQTAVPMGVFLMISLYIMLLFGTDVWRIYMQLF